MLTEAPRGGVDSRTHIGVSRVSGPSMSRSSTAPGASSTLGVEDCVLSPAALQRAHRLVSPMRPALSVRHPADRLPPSWKELVM